MVGEAASKETGEASWWPLAIAAAALLCSAFGALHRSSSSARLLEAVDQMRAGHLPLWRAANGYGEPLLAKGSLAVFSPTVLPLLRTPAFQVANFAVPAMEAPTKWRWAVREFIRLFLAGMGAALVARKLGQRGAGLAIAGACYLVGAAVLGQVGDTTAEGWCWLGWCFLALLGLMVRVTPARVAVAALPFAVIFSLGDVVAATAVLLICLGFQLGWPRRLGGVAPAFASVVAVLLGFTIAGAVWWPWWGARTTAFVATPLRPPGKVWIAGKMTWAKDRADARRLVAETTFDPKKTVLIDDDASADWADGIAILKAHPNAIHSSGVLPSRPPDLTLHEETPGHWRLNMPNAAGWLVVAQTYDPAWSARVVGKGWPLRESHDKIVLPGDGGLIAIPTRDSEPGELQLDYRPTSWRQGVMISAAAGAIVLLFLGFSLLGVAEDDLPAAIAIIEPEPPVVGSGSPLTESIV